LERGQDALDAVFDFTYDGAMRSIEASLTRLRLDRLDLVLVHDPDAHQDAALKGSYRALCALREQGVIAAIGIGTNRVEPLLRMGGLADFDCFLIAGRYTLLDHATVGELLALCERSSTSLIIGGVYNSGMLADPRPGQLYDYQRQAAGSPWLDRALKIKSVCERHGVPLPAAAIQFPLGHPAVATVLTGVKSVGELEANARLFNAPIPAELWDDLRTEGLLIDSIPVPAERARP
jgi:D-threo-aldose 1-dehydrogenase